MFFLACFFSLCIILYEVIKLTLKELRKSKNLTQAECADYLKMPLRTYQNYETDISKVNSMK